MARILLDANALLGFFKVNSPAMMAHAKTLVDLRDQIFVSEQVRNEVQRNKVRVASTFLEQEAKKIAVSTLSLPALAVPVSVT